MSDMLNPCVELCFQRYGRQYTLDCDDKCEYAKAVLENKALKQGLVSSVKHGYWHDVYMVNDNEQCMTCSECSSTHTANWKTIVEHCPSCGAKMDAQSGKFPVPDWKDAKRYLKALEFVHAMRFTRDNWSQVYEFTKGNVSDFQIERRPDGNCTCRLADDECTVHEGDYIVESASGKFFVMKPDVFEKWYTEVSEDV